MNRRSVTLFIAFFGIFGYHAASAEERWVWSDRNRNDRAFHVNRDERAVSNDKSEFEHYVRNRREREPTTRRPIPGAPPSNDDIDDYEDDNDSDKNRIGTRNYPYVPNGFYNNQLAGNGYSGYPGIGGFGANSASNGILVGPGGPTGFIGRPQTYYPGSAGGQPGGFATSPGGGINIGFPIQAASIGGVPGVYSNGFGQTQGFPVTQGGQYPGTVNYPNGQFPGNLFGGTASAGAQYPGIGNYPATAGQYPVAANGPLYTEGYGLANLNGYSPTSTGIFPQNFIGAYNGFRTRSDEKLKAENKSASLDSGNFSDKNVDDKINRNLKKST